MGICIASEAVNIDERITMRARQILGDPGVPRLKNQEVLLKTLADSVRGNDARLASLLAEINDEDVRERLRVALAVTP